MDTQSLSTTILLALLEECTRCTQYRGGSREGREPVVGPRVCRAPLRDRRIHRVLRRYGVPEANTGRASRWRWRRRRRWRRRWRLGFRLGARRASSAGVEGAVVGGRARQALLTVGNLEAVAETPQKPLLACFRRALVLRLKIYVETCRGSPTGPSLKVGTSMK